MIARINTEQAHRRGNPPPNLGIQIEQSDLAVPAVRRHPDAKRLPPAPAHNAVPIDPDVDPMLTKKSDDFLLDIPAIYD